MSKKKEYKHLFFRGISEERELLPKIFRNYNNSKREKILVVDFNHNARVLGISYNFPEDIDKMLVYMNEYGIPTRLLDWTISPLNALYFACSNIKERYNTDSYVLVLNPWGLFQEIKKEIINKKIGKLHPMYHIAQIKARSLLALGWNFKYIKSYIKKLYGYNLSSNSLKFPYPFIISYDNPRIFHQRGAFIIYGEEKVPIDKIVPIKKNVMKIIKIKKEFRKQILEELNYLYINSYSIFHDSYGMSEVMKKYGSLYNVIKKERPHL